jgi:hypothetical protein
MDGNNPQKTHYVWIKDLARMLFKNSAHRHRQHPCRRCLYVFTTSDLLESHKNLPGYRREATAHGNARRRGKHPEVLKPPQTDARAIHHIRRLRGAECAGVWLRGQPSNKLDPPDRETNPVRLLLCGGPQRRRGDRPSSIPRRKRGRALLGSSTKRT